MSVAVSIGNQTWTLLAPQALVPANGFPRAIMNRCPPSRSGNPVNSCDSLRSIDFYNTLVSQGTQGGQVVAIQQAASNAAFDTKNFSQAIAALNQVKGYYEEVEAIAIEKRNWLLWMRGSARKGRCCQNYGAMQTYIDETNNIIAFCRTRIDGLDTTIQTTNEANSAFYSAETDDLQLEEYRAQVNYQISQTNQQIAKEGFITSQLALSEGSGKLIYVAMALVAAFFVYRFVFRK